MNALNMVSTPLMPAPVPVAMLCPEYVIVDIETEGGDPAQVWEWVRRNWWPNEEWKPETMGKRLIEAVEKKKEKLALLDSAEIATVQLKTAAGHLVFHKFRDRMKPEPERKDLVACANEAEMLGAVAQWLNTYCSEGTTLVGWNVNGFDLPRLRLRMVKAGLALPPALMGMCGVLDLMKRYAYEFSVERSEFVALADALESLGMVNHKKEMNGALVGEFLERGEFLRVIDYGIADVYQEEQVFLKMTGRAAA